MLKINKNLKDNLIGDRAFYAKVITIAVPLMIQNTITNVVSLLDNVMVGRVGTLEMSAVAIINQLLFVYNLCIFGGLAGAGIFSTQFAGAKDDKGVGYCFRVKLIIAAAMFGIALLVFTVFPRQIIGMYLAKDTAAEIVSVTTTHAQNYLKIMLIGLLPFAFSQVYASTLRELGETKLPMFSSIASIVVNLVLNWLLIFGKLGCPRLGVVGAAIATVLSRYVELSIIIIATHARKKEFAFIKGVYKSIYIPKTLAKDIGKRGLPLLANEFLWAAGMAVLLQCYSVRGLQVVAAANIASNINNLFNVVFISMGSSIAIMVGQCLGAGKTEKAKQTAWRLIFATFLACVLVGAVLALISPYVPNMYKTEPEVKRLATKLLFVFAGAMPFYSIAHNCYFTIRSGGKTGITFIFDSAFTWGVCVPIAFFLANFTSVPIVPLYIIVQSIEFIKGVIGFILIKKGIWINKLVGETNNE